MGESAFYAYGICERHSDGFWAEPLNALSNGAFLYAAIVLGFYFRKLTVLKNKNVWDIRFLLALMPCIAVASFSFHTMPGPLTERLDLIFIVTFICFYFISALFRIMRCNLFEAVICILAFAGTTHILVHQFPNAMNDSIGYLSSMAALMVMAFYLNMKRRAASREFLVAALIGVASLFFRSVDRAACPLLPFGTHFLWHSLNALLCFVMMKQLIRSVTRKPRHARVSRKKADKPIEPSI